MIFTFTFPQKKILLNFRYDFLNKYYRTHKIKWFFVSLFVYVHMKKGHFVDMELSLLQDTRQNSPSNETNFTPLHPKLIE